MKVPSSTRAKLPRMAGRPFLTLAVAAALVAGCGAEPSAAALKANVRYEKGGGFAGVTQRLTVRPDGTGVAADGQDRRTFRLSAGRRRAVERAVRAADLAHTKTPKERRGGADGFGYSVAYGPHEVEWSSFSDDPPARVQRLYDLLDELYERYAPSS